MYPCPAEETERCTRECTGCIYTQGCTGVHIPGGYIGRRIPTREAYTGRDTYQEGIPGYIHTTQGIPGYIHHPGTPMGMLHTYGTPMGMLHT